MEWDYTSIETLSCTMWGDKLKTLTSYCKLGPSCVKQSVMHSSTKVHLTVPCSGNIFWVV